VSAGIKALLPALTTGTVAVGKWAEEHPMAAQAIYHTLKAVISHSDWCWIEDCREGYRFCAE
jgi:hypothetical protein